MCSEDDEEKDDDDADEGDDGEIVDDGKADDERCGDDDNKSDDTDDDDNGDDEPRRLRRTSGKDGKMHKGSKQAGSSNLSCPCAVCSWLAIRQLSGPLHGDLYHGSSALYSLSAQLTC